jgi:hypothetical protein
MPRSLRSLVPSYLSTVYKKNANLVLTSFTNDHTLEKTYWSATDQRFVPLETSSIVQKSRERIAARRKSYESNYDKETIATSYSLGSTLTRSRTTSTSSTSSYSSGYSGYSSRSYNTSGNYSSGYSSTSYNNYSSKYGGGVSSSSTYGGSTRGGVSSGSYSGKTYGTASFAAGAYSGRW